MLDKSPSKHFRAVTFAALILISASANSDPRELVTPLVTLAWDSAQLPDDEWQVSAGYLSPTPDLTREGWVFFGGTNLKVALLPRGPVVNPALLNQGLAGLNLQLEFHSPNLLALDSQWALATWADATSMVVTSHSLMTPPAASQFVTARGVDRLDIGDLATGGALNSFLSPLATGSAFESVNHIGMPEGGWSGAPRAAGAWQIALSQTLVGSYHLMPGLPGCYRVECMNGQYASFRPERIELEFVLSHDIRLHAVPEPGSAALLLAGLVWLQGRRKLARI